MFAGQFIVLGVSGSISCYKAADLASALVQRGATVQVVMTAAAQKFIQPLTFESLTHRPVVTDLYAENISEGISHIRLAEQADALVIAPASADFLAKLAYGLADDSLTCTALACRAPLILAPAMNTQMYAHPATQANLATLRERGAFFIGPDHGRLAEGSVGLGRLARLESLIDGVATALGQSSDLAGRRIVVTAGPTREAIDPVRYISNRSSGKMGYALATAARNRGAHVTLIAGPSALDDPFGIEVIHVTTAAQMATAVRDVLAPNISGDRQAAVDALIMAAAVADYTVDAPAEQKMKRSSATLTLSLQPTVDILRSLGSIPHLLKIGFAAETQDLLAAAATKLRTKGLDLLVANDVSEPGAGFEVDTNHVWLVTPDASPVELPPGSKDAVADGILGRVVELLR